MKPEDTLKVLRDHEKKLREAKSKHVAVGLPKEKTSSKIYANGQTVAEIGAQHEYGTAKIPRRSFLRMPLLKKKPEMDKHIKRFYKKVFEEGMSVDKALSLIGVEARNIVMDAFASEGFGQWQKSEKAGKTLFDTGTLRNSITYVVRSGK